MDNLQDFLEADRERVLTGLKSAQTPEAAQAVLEKETDRLLLQYNEECTSARMRDAASGMMQALRSSVPLLDSAGEVRVWRRGEVSGGSASGAVGRTGSGVGGTAGAGHGAKGAGLSGILLCVGAALSAAAFFAPALFTGGMGALPSLFKGILLPLLGGGCLYSAGRMAGKNARIRIGGSAGSEDPEERIEITIDPEKLWNSLRGAVMVVDRNLAAVQEAEEFDRGKELAAVSGAKGVSAEEIELFSGLLELARSGASGQAGQINAGGSVDPGLSQMAEDIRYYLHRKNVEVIEWSEKYASWFEILPGLSKSTGGHGEGKALTIRPALAQNGRLLKKGLAIR